MRLSERVGRGLKEGKTKFHLDDVAPLSNTLGQVIAPRRAITNASNELLIFQGQEKVLGWDPP